MSQFIKSIIFAADLGYGSLGCFGNTEVKPPNIDRLAAGGVRLTDFHSNGAMCSPARAAFMTGRYRQRCAWARTRSFHQLIATSDQVDPAQRWAWGIVEDIARGERVREYIIEGRAPGGEWVQLGAGQSIGHKRIQSFARMELAAVRLHLTRSAATPKLRRLAVFDTGG